jgi:hypothetical protein
MLSAQMANQSSFQDLIPALINDCILVAFTVPAMESLYGVLPKRVKSYQHQHGI